MGYQKCEGQEMDSTRKSIKKTKNNKINRNQQYSQNMDNSNNKRKPQNETKLQKSFEGNPINPPKTKHNFECAKNRHNLSHEQNDVPKNVKKSINPCKLQKLLEITQQKNHDNK